MLVVARTFITADRNGSWLLHLSAVSDCLPIFAAAPAGHYSYLKSVQEMAQLENTHPDMFHKFSNGLHVIHRSDRYWAGLSSDLVIEQTLMNEVPQNLWWTDTRKWHNGRAEIPVDHVTSH